MEKTKHKKKKVHKDDPKSLFSSYLQYNYKSGHNIGRRLATKKVGSYNENEYAVVYSEWEKPYSKGQSTSGLSKQTKESDACSAKKGNSSCKIFQKKKEEDNSKKKKSKPTNDLFVQRKPREAYLNAGAIMQLMYSRQDCVKKKFKDKSDALNTKEQTSNHEKDEITEEEEHESKKLKDKSLVMSASKKDQGKVEKKSKKSESQGEEGKKKNQGKQERKQQSVKGKLTQVESSPQKRKISSSDSDSKQVKCKKLKTEPAKVKKQKRLKCNTCGNLIKNMKFQKGNTQSKFKSVCDICEKLRKNKKINKVKKKTKYRRHKKRLACLNAEAIMLASSKPWPTVIPVNFVTCARTQREKDSIELNRKYANILSNAGRFWVSGLGDEVLNGQTGEKSNVESNKKATDKEDFEIDVTSVLNDNQNENLQSPVERVAESPDVQIVDVKVAENVGHPQSWADPVASRPVVKQIVHNGQSVPAGGHHSAGHGNIVLRPDPVSPHGCSSNLHQSGPVGNVCAYPYDHNSVLHHKHQKKESKPTQFPPMMNSFMQGVPEQRYKYFQQFGAPAYRPYQLPNSNFAQQGPMMSALQDSVTPYALLQDSQMGHGYPSCPSSASCDLSSNIKPTMYPQTQDMREHKDVINASGVYPRPVEQGTAGESMQQQPYLNPRFPDCPFPRPQQNQPVFSSQHAWYPPYRINETRVNPINLMDRNATNQNTFYRSDMLMGNTRGYNFNPPDLNPPFSVAYPNAMPWDQSKPQSNMKCGYPSSHSSQYIPNVNVRFTQSNPIHSSVNITCTSTRYSSHHIDAERKKESTAKDPQKSGSTFTYSQPYMVNSASAPSSRSESSGESCSSEQSNENLHSTVLDISDNKVKVKTTSQHKITDYLCDKEYRDSKINCSGVVAESKITVKTNTIPQHMYIQESKDTEKITGSSYHGKVAGSTSGANHSGMEINTGNIVSKNCNSVKINTKVDSVLKETAGSDSLKESETDCIEVTRPTVEKCENKIQENGNEGCKRESKGEEEILKLKDDPGQTNDADTIKTENIIEIKQTITQDDNDGTIRNCEGTVDQDNVAKNGNSERDNKEPIEGEQNEQHLAESIAQLPTNDLQVNSTTIKVRAELKISLPRSVPVRKDSSCPKQNQSASSTVLPSQDTEDSESQKQIQRPDEEVEKNKDLQQENVIPGLKNFSENLETMPVTCKGKVNYLEEPKSLSVKGWHLHGEAYTHRSCQNPLAAGEDVKIRYPSICHDCGDIVRVRDCVLIKSGPRKKDIPYIAKVASFWATPEGDIMMKVLWYYRPEHTESERLPLIVESEIFASKHWDVVSVACIEDKCYVLTSSEYFRYQGQLKMLEEGRIPVPPVVPSAGQAYQRKPRLPPLDANPETVFLCRYVYDIKLRRVLLRKFVQDL